MDAWRFAARVEQARRAPAAQVRKSLTEALGWWHGPAFQEHEDESWAVPEAARPCGVRLHDVPGTEPAQRTRR